MNAAAVVAVVGLAGAALALAARGDGPGHEPSVYAAASLRGVLEAVDGRARLSFAGSGQLQRQILAGAPADVFAAASAQEPAELHAAGRCTEPRPFATNRLALLVRRGATPVRSVGDLAHPGRRLALGGASVPVGRAARQALRRMGIDLRRAVVSSESSVAGVVAKVALGSADAGIGYVTDARTAGDRLSAVPIPASAQPAIEYHVCAVVRPGADRDGARRFIDRLTGAPGRAALRAAGFGLPR